MMQLTNQNICKSQGSATSQTSSSQRDLVSEREKGYHLHLWVLRYREDDTFSQCDLFWFQAKKTKKGCGMESHVLIVGVMVILLL